MVLSHATLPERRRPLLKRLLLEQRLIRAIECHNPLSALLGSSVETQQGGRSAGFDVLWASGFGHATAMGLPDTEMSILERRLDAIADVAAVTAKPILADGDTGGDAMAFAYLCRRLESLGVSAVVVEDKTGAKRSSLAANVSHELEDPEVFVGKIARAKEALLTPDFLVFARIESLISGVGMQDALMRAGHYLRSPADGVVIHSKDRTGGEILFFMKEYRRLQSELGIEKPLVCIPTAYNHIRGAELYSQGARIVVHGNHMVRSAYRAMQAAARSILEHDRSLEADELCAPVDELFAAIGVQ
jgi:2-methylisocitrate lyase-like PEP mutase family enzyme